MRSAAVFSSRSSVVGLVPSAAEAVEIGGIRIACGLREAEAPTLDPGAEQDAHRVLVRVRAFSCNYRDKALMLRVALLAPPDSVWTIGSEFVGEVLAVGRAVTRVRVGDRVMGDNGWPAPRAASWRGGIPTSNASREYLVLREEKLARVPAGMSDDAAAAFSVAAQTGCSLIERLGVGAGSHVLVTAARSNTSLAALQLLRARGAIAYALTTAPGYEQELRELGATEVIRVPRAPAELREHRPLAALAHDLGGFEAVVDPFLDLHLARLLPLLAYDARYVTCGLHDIGLQHFSAAADEPPAELTATLRLAIVRNVQIRGNCLGRPEHLEQALRDYAAGAIRPVIDCVVGDGGVAHFLDRTYNAPDRFGKVVFAYA